MSKILKIICFGFTSGLTVVGSLIALVIGVSAVVPGNNAGNVTAPVVTGVGQLVIATETPVAYATPSITQGISGIDPLPVLIIGVIIILIGAGGLVWRYLHPRYIPPEEKK